MGHDGETRRERRVPAAGLAGVAALSCVLVALASGGDRDGTSRGLGQSGAADVLSLVGVLGFTVLLLSGAVLFLVLLASPPRPISDDAPRAAPRRRSRGAVVLVATGAVSLVFLVGRGVAGDDFDPGAALDTSPFADGVDTSDRTLSSTQELASQAVGLVVGLAAVLMVGGALVVAVLRLRSRTRGAVAEEADSEPAPVAATEPTAHEDLASAEPRRAVLLAWDAAEGLLAADGHGRRPAETATEHVDRVAPSLPAPAGAAVVDLSGLFQEARFSTHPTTEDTRTVALRDLDEVRAALDPAIRATGAAATDAEESAP